MLRCLSYSVVSRSLGILLLAAAGLKLNGLAVDPVGRMGLFTLPAFQIAVVEFEIFLAVWLLWGRLPLGSWATALGVFTVFAGVSAYQGWIGALPAAVSANSRSVRGMLSASMSPSCSL